MGKEFGEYWSVIMLPLAIWVLLDLLLFVAYFVPFLALLGILLFPINLLVGLWIGWSMVKSHGGTLVHAFVAGAIAGVINTIVSTVLNAVAAVATGNVVGLVVVVIAGVVGGIFALVIAGIVAAIGGFLAGLFGGKKGL